MKVPEAPGGEAQQMPSEANLLMALAEMHKQGRFQVAGDVVDATKRFQGKQVSIGEYYGPGGIVDKNQTKAILNDALDAKSNVLPMRPK